MADDRQRQNPALIERLPRSGLRVPIPRRKDVLDAIEKVSRPDDEDEQPVEGEDSA